MMFVMMIMVMMTLVLMMSSQVRAIEEIVGDQYCDYFSSSLLSMIMMMIVLVMITMHGV